MSASELQTEPVYKNRVILDNQGQPVPDPEQKVLYHLLPEEKVREPQEGPLSLEERHKRSQEVALGLRHQVETESEKTQRLQQEAQVEAAWQAEKARREQDAAEKAAWLASQQQRN